MEGSHHKLAAKLQFISEEEETDCEFTVDESQPKTSSKKAHYWTQTCRYSWHHFVPPLSPTV